MSLGRTNRVLIGVAMITAYAGCGRFGIGTSGPADAANFSFEVEYGNRSPGEAQVTYTTSDGQTVTTQVTTPWVSESIPVNKGQTYRLTASAPRRSDAALYCGAHLDTGWNSGNAIEGDNCSFTFPDDATR
jgi:hypothetical protein